MYDEIEEADTHQSEELWDDFDNMFKLLAATELSNEDIFAIALRFCFHWTPKQIAIQLNVPSHKVYRQIQKVKARMKKNYRPLAALSPKRDIELKMLLGHSMVRAGINPMDGKTIRNSQMFSEAYHLFNLAQKQYPQDPKILAALLQVAFTRLRWSQYQDDTVWPLKEWEWNRQRWDEKLRQVAFSYYEKLMALKLSPTQLLHIQFFYDLYRPRTNEDVDWEKLFNICEESLRIETSHSNYWE